jgi:hypothetical protein
MFAFDSKWGDPAEDITPFTQNATSSKMGKYRFIEGFVRSTSGAKARLA